MILRLKNLETNIVEYDGIKFIRIQNERQLVDALASSIDGVILTAESSERLNKLVRLIRLEPSPEAYLMPIFIQSVKTNAALQHHVDGIIEGENLYQAAKKTSDIQKKIATIQNESAKHDPKQLDMLKILQYGYTRNSTVSPFRNRFAPIGYSIPFINSIIDNQENIRIINNLESLVEKDYLTTKIVDRVNLCNSCESSYLNFRETCAKCNSIDLKPEALIHHFRCAYVGPEGDFQKDNDLVCPKCDKTLRHIGIDYDKPSEINNCNSCGHQSQESTMKAHCVDCGTEGELPFIQSKTINAYALTAYGEKIAKNGFPQTTTQAATPLNQNTISPNIFELLLNQEKKRAAFNTIPSAHSKVTISEGVFDFLDADTKALLSIEIIKIIQSYLRPLDFVSASDFEHYDILLPNIASAQLTDMNEVLTFNLNKLLSHNLPTEAAILNITTSIISA